MAAFLMTVFKTVFTEWLVKRLAYLALKSLAASSKNDLAKEAAFTVGQSLGLEKKAPEDG